MSSFLLRSSLSFLTVVVLVTSGVFTSFSRAREADKKFPGFQLEGASRETNPCTAAVSWMYDFAKDICRVCCGLPWPLTYCPSTCKDYETYCSILHYICDNNYYPEPPVEKMYCCSDKDCLSYGSLRCNTKAKECVQCTYAYHCPDDKPICDNYKCRKCYDDSDCSSNYYNVYPYCYEGECCGCVDSQNKWCKNGADGQICFGTRCGCNNVSNCYNYYDYGCCNTYCCLWDKNCTGFINSECKIG